MRGRPGRLTETIIGAAIEVHRMLGPGSHESTYQAYLLYDVDPFDGHSRSAQCRQNLLVDLVCPAHSVEPWKQPDMIDDGMAAFAVRARVAGAAENESGW